MSTDPRIGRGEAEEAAMQTTPMCDCRKAYATDEITYTTSLGRTVRRVCAQCATWIAGLPQLSVSRREV